MNRKPKMKKSEPTQSDLSLTELSALIGITKQTLLVRASKGELPGVYRFGNVYRFRREALAALRGISL